ncbi:aminopeptidase [Streptomyces lunaelactis]|uniref:S28 family serine protease n=1 Tax=Streptomyces lunaelactis TaxID=1535768 RepID=UPI001585B070|nr:S28 family serine protease [Streptomyces lunaelactis]NUK50242.1 aminopeptidase [Streptomyces lunaelactis]NUK64568.1 aminopeptidase [Streptomyces lunaelactis]
MKNATKRLLRLVLVVALSVTGLSTPALAQPPNGDFRARIEAIPGMRVLGERPAAPGQIVLDLAYRQPTDHRHPDEGSFDQRLTLVHKSTQRPMVLYSSGYDLGPSPNRLTEPTELLDANQITTEQRFFGTSRPEGSDWSKLTIWQAASDHHRLVTALRKLYRGAWISTGGSKGGMTAVYHRRFYPEDVAGTVAYSAPNNTDDRDDSAYDARLEQIGTAECRAAVKSVQREALIRREAMTERYGRWAEGERNTFRTIGSVDRAFELAVLRLPMMFWMHQPTGGCASIPTAAATDDVLYAWVAKVTQLPVYTDQTLEAFTPYFYQLGTQLGYAQFVTPYLDGLLRYPGIQEIRSYVPRDIPLRFRAAAMADIDRWVRHRGSSLMFVDGENDVAVAEPFRLGNGTHDSYLFNVPGANHHVSITGLRPDDAEQATVALRRWAGTSAGSVIGAQPAVDHQRRPDVSPCRWACLRCPRCCR